MLLAIIVGHEAVKPGVKAAFPIDCHEYEFNKNLAVDIYRYARESNIDCRIFLRDGIGRSGVSNLVNAWIEDGLACSIELHLNAFDRWTRGTETLYIGHNLESRRLAESVQLNMVKVFRSSGVSKQNRGIKLLDELSRGYLNMRDIKCPSCLVEPVFADNLDEAQLLQSKRLEYARGLVSSAIEFLNNTGRLK